MLLKFRQSSTHLLLTLCLLAMTSGCGPSVTSETVTPPPPPNVKAMLEDVASSGELGSGADSIRSALEQLKATDATKAEELLKDLSVLETTQGAAKIKSKAKEMAGKL